MIQVFGRNILAISGDILAILHIFSCHTCDYRWHTCDNFAILAINNSYLRFLIFMHTCEKIPCVLAKEMSQVL